MIFDHFIWVKNIRTYLASPLYFFSFCYWRHLLFHCAVVIPFHTNGFSAFAWPVSRFAELAPVLLANYNNAGWNMCKLNFCFYFVYILSACTTTSGGFPFFTSAGFISIFMVSSTNGYTLTETKDVCLLALLSKRRNAYQGDVHHFLILKNHTQMLPSNL